MDPKNIRAWGQLAVSVLIEGIFLVIVVLAFYENDAQLKQMILAAVLGYVAAVNHFYLGDAAGSQTKDEVIAASEPPRPPRPDTPPASGDASH